MIRLPHPRHRRALIIVDVEPRFLTAQTEKVVPGIIQLIEEGNYALTVVAEHTRGRVHARALSHPRRTRSDETLPDIALRLDPRRTILVAKDTRSAFGNGNDLASDLRRRRITGVHIVGIETHDCVLATAIDAFDQEFATCIIERACASRRRPDHEAGLRVLRRLHLTDRTFRL